MCLDFKKCKATLERAKDMNVSIFFFFWLCFVLSLLNCFHLPYITFFFFFSESMLYLIFVFVRVRLRLTYCTSLGALQPVSQGIRSE